MDYDESVVLTNPMLSDMIGLLTHNINNQKESSPFRAPPLTREVKEEMQRSPSFQGFDQHFGDN